MLGLLHLEFIVKEFNFRFPVLIKIIRTIFFIFAFLRPNNQKSAKLSIDKF